MTAAGTGVRFPDRAAAVKSDHRSMREGAAIGHPSEKAGRHEGVCPRRSKSEYGLVRRHRIRPRTWGGVANRFGYSRQRCAARPLGCAAPVRFGTAPEISSKGRIPHEAPHPTPLRARRAGTGAVLRRARRSPDGRPRRQRIAVPAEVESIVSLAPSITQVVEALGLTGKLVGVDTQSPLYVAGLDELPQFDMMAPDVEQIAALEPDIVFASGISYLDGDPFAALEGMGICVVDIPSSTSIAAVGEDVLFTAQCLGMADEGQALVDEMNAKIDEIAAIGATIEDKKTVLFEISALPSIYSFGAGTFLDEMISIIGAENVFAGQEGWIAVTEEDAVASNPDVILTSVNYIEDPVGEILGRAGWEAVTAVANGDVHYIDNGASSLPNQHIVDALIEMAVAVYPDAYAEYAE